MWTVVTAPVLMEMMTAMVERVLMAGERRLCGVARGWTAEEAVKSGVREGWSAVGLQMGAVHAPKC